MICEDKNGRFVGIDVAATHPDTHFKDGGSSAAREILRDACPGPYQQCKELLQTSIPPTIDSNKIIPRKNGFVHTVLEAYNQHRALVVRPDDVWLAILTQFSAYVNAHAEELRTSFVAHEDKKELVVIANGNRYSVDFGDLSRQMTGEMHKNVVDPALRDWVMPMFSTTTVTDTTVYAMVMMASMKAYFDYRFGLRCGIPRVTLDGTRADWEAILVRLEKLKEYGLQTTAWYHLLRPVISRFVRAFDEPSSKANLDFWDKVFHRKGNASGPSFFMGWIAAFCVFTDEGHWQGPKLKETADTQSAEYVSLSTEQFTSKLFEKHTETRFTGPLYLELDGVQYPHITSIPNGFAEVDVLLDDNGELFRTLLTAGSIGTLICSSRDKTVSTTGIRDTVQSVPGWWMFIKNSEEETEKAQKNPFGL
ncbi:hypothetical protein CONPUDRAFT_138932 [Coniophora puteana RWD-64-598 SS2]|uniref:Uncharacterized protein n=1 Tax=Coniophora puteana (strain RWD-64-598) TaxID=741705 RepID=A0A5M3MEP2_CONPW|nr:uncharacterized protein CONPUDRAFT_138932 [Coniophora puteana RWD-64-598 SS2]EIW77692.1 hypothetical protein CONPUDRAFT_138932 [Coniophora puteana RWD-64-598 SS2]